MKRLITAFALVLIASFASAQADVTIGAVTKTANAAQVAKNTRGKILDSAALCLAKGAVGGATCTQAQLNAVPGCAAGACGTVYAPNAAGDASYALDSMFACHFERLDSKLQEINIRDLVAQTIANGNAVATNLECANAMGGTLGNGCTKFQIMCRTATSGLSDTCK